MLKCTTHPSCKPHELFYFNIYQIKLHPPLTVAAILLPTAKLFFPRLATPSSIVNQHSNINHNLMTKMTTTDDDNDNDNNV